jgi:hypothetical protein
VPDAGRSVAAGERRYWPSWNKSFGFSLTVLAQSDSETPGGRRASGRRPARPPAGRAADADWRRRGNWAVVTRPGVDVGLGGTPFPWPSGWPGAAGAAAPPGRRSPGPARESDSESLSSGPSPIIGWRRRVGAGLSQPEASES